MKDLTIDRLAEIVRNELELKGVCKNELREELIEHMIMGIGEDPENWAKSNYYGFKNYAHFSDQQIVCPYGKGPSHGSVVFSIGRRRKYDPAKKEEYIRTLLIFRDLKNPDHSLNTICDLYLKAKTQYETCLNLLSEMVSYTPEI